MDVAQALALVLVLMQVVVGSTVELADEDGVTMLVLLKTGVEDVDEMMEELGSSVCSIPIVIPILAGNRTKGCSEWQQVCGNQG